MLRFSDARNFGRTATGLLLIVGPLLLLVGSIVGPDTGDGNSVKDKLHELATVQAHKGSFLLGNIIFMTAGLCLVLAGFGLVKYFKGPRGVTLGQVAGVFLALGSTISGSGTVSTRTSRFPCQTTAFISGPLRFGVLRNGYPAADGANGTGLLRNGESRVRFDAGSACGALPDSQIPLRRLGAQVL